MDVWYIVIQNLIKRFFVKLQLISKVSKRNEKDPQEKTSKKL